ncbi:MAG: hypothetical protein ABL929_01105 [Ferruginibacter sp.]|nr:3-hydroxyacyl-ACP dehydratase [Ferruginibacter sp.]
MLLNNFFEIKEIGTENFETAATIIINVQHQIFEGHFPQQPVVPGVCMMQMVKEILEQVLEKKANLISSAEMKFLAIINPVENNSIDVSLKHSFSESGNVNVVATFFKNDLMHFKFKGEFSFL